MTSNPLCYSLVLHTRWCTPVIHRFNAGIGALHELPGSPPDGSLKLVTLHPGLPKDPIKVSLSYFHSKDTPSYECLAYDHTAEDLEACYVYRDENQIAISYTLHTALKALRRHADRGRLIWVDVLCGDGIPSNDILTNAQTVFIWLGEGMSKTPEAFQILRILASRYTEVAAKLNFPKRLFGVSAQQMTEVSRQLQSYSQQELKSHDVALWNAVNNILSAPFFRSINALTYICLAENVTIACKGCSISWQNYMAAWRGKIYGANLPGQLDPQNTELVFDLDIAVRRYRENGVELLPLIQQTRHTTCLDPRDHIYAILPLVSPSRRVEILGQEAEELPCIDYNKPIEKVFEEYAEYVIAERQDLLIWANEVAPSARLMANLPSWIPDWSNAGIRTTSALKLPANHKLRSWGDSVVPKKPMKTADGSLFLQGCIIDTIVYVSAVFSADNCRKQVMEHMYNLPDLRDETETNALWRTFLIDHVSMQRPAPAELASSFLSVVAQERVLAELNCTLEELSTDTSIQARVRNDKHLVDLCSLGAKANTEAYSVPLMQNATGRRFFKTEQGRKGMSAVEGPNAPGGVKIGDKLVTLVGGFFPYVLRAKDDSKSESAASGTYEFIGEAYVHGVMDGECLRKSAWLSSGWKNVDIIDVEIV